MEQTQAKIDAVNKIISVDALVGIFEAIEQADRIMKEAAAREVEENEPLIYQKQNFFADIGKCFPRWDCECRMRISSQRRLSTGGI